MKVECRSQPTEGMKPATPHENRGAEAYLQCTLKSSGNTSARCLFLNFAFCIHAFSTFPQCSPSPAAGIPRATRKVRACCAKSATSGFDFVELSHGVRVSLVGGIQEVVNQGEVRISSLHNFCPLPLEVQGASPDCYEFTSHRPFDQQRAVKLSLQTIDFASRLGAGVVVLHLGTRPHGAGDETAGRPGAGRQAELQRMDQAEDRGGQGAGKKRPRCTGSACWSA